MPSKSVTHTHGLTTKRAKSRSQSRSRVIRIGEAGGILLVGIFGIAAMVMSIFLWGFKLWMPIHVGVTVAALALKGMKGAVVSLIGACVFALDLSVYAWGLPLWIPQVLGIGSIALLVIHFTSTQGGGMTEEANSPVRPVIIIVCARVFLAIVAGTAGEVETIPPCDDLGDVLTGCTGTIGAISGLVLGTIAGAPAAVNAIIAFIQTAYLIWAILRLVL